MPYKNHATIQITITEWRWRPRLCKKVSGWMLNTGMWLNGATKYRMKAWVFDPADVRPAPKPTLK